MTVIIWKLHNGDNWQLTGKKKDMFDLDKHMKGTGANFLGLPWIFFRSKWG